MEIFIKYEPRYFPVESYSSTGTLHNRNVGRRRILLFDIDRRRRTQQCHYMLLGGPRRQGRRGVLLPTGERAGLIQSSPRPNQSDERTALARWLLFLVLIVVLLIVVMGGYLGVGVMTVVFHGAQAHRAAGTPRLRPVPASRLGAGHHQAFHAVQGVYLLQMTHGCQIH